MRTFAGTGTVADSAQPATGETVGPHLPGSDPTMTRAADRKPGSALQRQRRRLYVPFVAPALVLYTIFLLAPVVATAWISLHKWPGYGPMEWSDARNYRYLLADPVFQQGVQEHAAPTCRRGCATFAISFCLTMLLRDLAGRSTVRSVIFFPNIVPALVFSILWGFLFQADGLVNRVLHALVIQHPPAWLSQDHQYSMILVGLVWISTGFYRTIIMAAVDRIPPYLYEDCLLDRKSVV